MTAASRANGVPWGIWRQACVAGRLGLAVGMALAVEPAGLAEPGAAPEQPLCVVVMDPLAARLSCPCVAGYAQRDYAALAGYLEETLRRRVKLAFGDSLASALKADGEARADVVIGKESVVRADGRAVGIGLEPVCSLTDTAGSCAIGGLFVVPADDAAESVEDLVDYAIFVGSAEHDEKHGLAVESLRRAGLPEPFDVHEFPTCSDAAADMLEMVQPAQVAAVISSYAAPLLEGCGAVPQGALRVIGETEPVRFVTAFVNRDLGFEARDRIAEALLDVGKHADLCRKLESAVGFVRMPVDIDTDWPGPRHPHAPRHGGPRRRGSARCVPVFRR